MRIGFDPQERREEQIGSEKVFGEMGDSRKAWA